MVSKKTETTTEKTISVKPQSYIQQGLQLVYQPSYAIMILSGQQDVDYLARGY